MAPEPQIREIESDVFTKLWCDLPQIRAESFSSFTAYLLRIVHGTSVDWLRKNFRTPEGHLIELPMSGEDERDDPFDSIPDHGLKPEDFVERQKVWDIVKSCAGNDDIKKHMIIEVYQKGRKRKDVVEELEEKTGEKLNTLQWRFNELKKHIEKSLLTVGIIIRAKNREERR